MLELGNELGDSVDLRLQIDLNIVNILDVRDEVLLALAATGLNSKHLMTLVLLGQDALNAEQLLTIITKHFHFLGGMKLAHVDLFIW